MSSNSRGTNEPFQQPNQQHQNHHNQYQRISLSRTKSLSNANRSTKNSIPENLGPLYSDHNEHDNDEALASLNAPLHSTLSMESIDRTSSSSPSRGLFESNYLNPSMIPGNLHSSSNKSIEHLVKRYGAVSLVRQLATDLAQREAEISLIRKQNSTRENSLIKLLNEMGLSTSEVELILKDRMEKSSVNSVDINDTYFLKDLINDAMNEHFDDVPQLRASSSASIASNTLTRTPNRGTTDNSTKKEPQEKANKTRPHSFSSPPIPSSNELRNNTSSASISSQIQSNSILNVVSHRFLNHVPQPVHDVIINNSTNNKKLVPMEMENFDPTDVKPPTYQTHTEDDRGYIDKFGFIYDRKSKKADPPSKLETSTKSPIDKSFTSRLLEIASDYDKSQDQNNRQWDEFIKKISLLSNDNNTGDLLAINGENLSKFKHLHKEFSKLVSNGIPMKYRAKIWSELTGSENLMTPSEYYKLVHESKSNEEAESQIELDLYRTMPFNIFFKDNGPGLKKLKNILIAYSRKFPNIGYCQGMNFIAANILLVFSNEEDAFWAFVGLVDNILPSDFFNLVNVKNDLALFRNIFVENLPRLSDHLTNIDVEIEPICFNWFISLFSDSLPIHIVFRIWDVMMLNGYTEMFKISVALFKVFEKNLLNLKSNVEVYEFMKNLNTTNINLKGSELIKVSSSISTLSAPSLKNKKINGH
ncbi:TBC domain-containing protein C4G8.04 [Wickerhamomyces ciferrii]|uniref:TBC domain-containing protein C4G8.04 n=1 Tax=Wickerhamomyces ciferrii (strain ATCC 14091 / BCRC 22168 / CBS 111 / JCM 3599 / NBRC 0793 / NRRL Y-1031 F-60-10) TaxID=1206466 RepID=K0KUF7_WICCF|nr:TBC domain-containing protein C4G8.04 [Wickerhamomyces ciferrii]CCH45069.1 TBC domain-containing protein C4G8.04 [Wickerhamomyces ciferrii]